MFFFKKIPCLTRPATSQQQLFTHRVGTGSYQLSVMAKITRLLGEKKNKESEAIYFRLFPITHMDVSKNRGKTLQNGWSKNGKPYEQMDDLGVPLFLETSI